MSWVKIVLWIELAAFIAALVLALGHKFSVLPFKPAFLGFAACALVVVLVFCLALLMVALSVFVSRVQLVDFIPHLVLGLIPFLAFFSLVGSGGLGVPKIHDISTRFEPPIAFSDLDTRRKPSDNPLHSQVPLEVQKAQQAHYTNLEALVVQSDPEQTFTTLKAAIEELGWQIVAEDTEGKWIEAVDETFLFGFKDDVRVELRKLDQGVRLDARSVSRVGVSDLGANAKRIQSLWDKIGK